MNDTRYHIKNIYGDRFEPYEYLEDALRDWCAAASDLAAIFQCGRMVAFTKRRDWHPEEFCGADDNLFIGWRRDTYIDNVHHWWDGGSHHSPWCLLLSEGGVVERLLKSESEEEAFENDNDD